MQKADPSVHRHFFNVSVDIATLPKMRMLCDQLIVSDNDSYSIDIFKPAFEDLLKSKECTLVLETALTRLADDVMYCFKSLSIGLVIFQNKNYSLNLVKINPRKKQPTMLATAPSAFIIGVHSSHALIECRQYTLPAGFNMEVFDPDVKLIESKSVTIPADQYSIIFHKNSVSELVAAEPVVLLRLIESSAVPYQWVFDCNTLRPRFVGATHPSISRLQTVIDVIEALCDRGRVDEKSVAIVKNLTDSRYYFIRWKATQALFRLDRKAGVEAVRKALNDTNYHVRKAARLSLDRIARE